MRLLIVNHTNHPGATSGAVYPTNDIIVVADFRIADIDRLRALQGLEVFVFEHIEPEPLTVRTAIHLNTLVTNLLHIRATLRASHIKTSKSLKAVFNCYQSTARF